MLDKLKHMFSAGGVSVKLTPPKVMKGSNPSLPVTVTLQNRTKEDRTVENILLELREKPAQGADNSPQHQSGGIQHLIDESITLQAGQTHEFTVDMPTTRAEAADALGVELPGWIKTASNVLGSSQGRNREYEICATPRVQGFNASKTVTRSLGKGFAFG